MLHINLVEILVQSLIAYVFVIGFISVGHAFLKIASTNDKASFTYGSLFSRFIAGLIITVCIYSVLAAKGVTINLLLLPLLHLLFVKKQGLPQADTTYDDKQFSIFGELALAVFLSILFLHLFPESEYKQADSFFYLKIAESLNATGQENLNHYFNHYNAAFNGVEPYHYFELWLTAMIMQVTDGFMASVDAERFVRHGIILSGVVLGLYFLVQELTLKKIDFLKKLYCWSLLFFIPNLLNYFPSLHQIFITDFEGNLLERPNFRVIYLLLIPVFASLYRHKYQEQVLYWLLILSVVSFVCAIAIVPALACYFFFMLFVKKQWQYKHEILKLIVFCLVMAGFYFLFKGDKLPALYQSDWKIFISKTAAGWKFIAFSIFTCSLYIALLAAIFLLPFYLIAKRTFTENVKSLFSKFGLVVLIACMGLLLARLLYQKDNAYQLLYIAHIVATVFIWLMVLLVLDKLAKPRFFLYASLMFIATLALKATVEHRSFFVDTFRQNGNFVYDGKPYSKSYLEAVKTYFQHHENITGGYIADSAFYAGTYYSRRNPNVYFLPVTYIVSKSTNQNFEFCLSDSTDIMVNVEYNLERDYLENAISRSYFYQYKNLHPNVEAGELLKKFIAVHGVHYLFVTRDVILNKEVLSMATTQVQDANTGERFIVFR